MLQNEYICLLIIYSINLNKHKSLLKDGGHNRPANFMTSSAWPPTLYKMDDRYVRKLSSNDVDSGTDNNGSWAKTRAASVAKNFFRKYPWRYSVYLFKTVKQLDVAQD
jgi:hypothetical protein